MVDLFPCALILTSVCLWQTASFPQVDTIKQASSEALRLSVHPIEAVSKGYALTLNCTEQILSSTEAALDKVQLFSNPFLPLCLAFPFHVWYLTVHEAYCRPGFGLLLSHL